MDLSPMEARLVDELPEEAGWQFEPKWDGFRCLAFRAGEEVELRAKSGKPLGRYFPEMTAALRQLKPSRFVLDGELAIPVGETFSFDALQMRLHPAESRIRKLAAETPTVLFLFDLLEGALARRLVGPPAQETGPVAKPAAADMVIANLDDQFEPQRLPFSGALGAPATGASRRVAGKARCPDERFELFGQRLAVEIVQCGGKPDIIELAFAVVEAE